jgi:hypothetical protein
MTRFDTFVLAWAAGLALLSGGCGNDGGSNPPLDGNMQEAIINGLPASQFYGQFAWQTTMTAVEGAAAFPLTDGRNAFLVSFFLMPNGAFELFYAEGNGEVSSTGWNISTVSNSKRRREGTWKVEGAKLVLGSFMTCDGFSLDDKPALHCTLSSSIVTPAAQGRTGTFQKRFSASSPDDTEFAEYVP